MRTQTDSMDRWSIHARSLALILAGVTLGACSDSPLGPDDAGAAMHVATTEREATTIGETMSLVAAVLTARGDSVPDATVAWEVSEPGVLEALGGGRFRVLRQGIVRVAAMWPRDPSVRAEIAVTVNASFYASACITRSDQDPVGAVPTCAQRRVVVSAAPVLSLTRAPSLEDGGRQ